MAIVATLDIVMRAQTDQATSKLSRSVSVLGRLKTALISAAAAYVSFAGAQRAVSSTLAGLDRLDSLVENADKLSMSANALYAMGNAAELAGGSMETVIKSISIMQRSIGTAAMSTGPTVFSRLGLEIKALKALAPEQQFIAIAEAIMRLPDATSRAKAANDVFGRGYRDLIPLMRDASGAISESSDFIKRFGGELSNLDISNIGRAQDAMDRLRQAVVLAWNSVATDLAPALERLLTRAIDLMAKLVKHVDEFSRGPLFALLTGTSTTFGIVPETPPLGDVNKINQLNAAFAELEEPKTIEVNFEGISSLQDLLNMDQTLKNKVVTIRANTAPVEKGSQEDLSKRLAVEIKTQQNIQAQQLSAQNEGNDVLRDIFDELKRQREEMSEDADL